MSAFFFFLIGIRNHFCEYMAEMAGRKGVIQNAAANCGVVGKWWYKATITGGMGNYKLNKSSNWKAYNYCTAFYPHKLLELHLSGLSIKSMKVLSISLDGSLVCFERAGFGSGTLPIAKCHLTLQTFGSKIRGGYLLPRQPSLILPPSPFPGCYQITKWWGTASKSTDWCC